jgi:hypothetical protein
MKAKDITVGGLYAARVAGRLTTVRVEAIRESAVYRARQPHTPVTLYDVTNTATGRRTTFRSARRFRGPAGAPAAPPRIPLKDARPGDIVTVAEGPRAGTTLVVGGPAWNGVYVTLPDGTKESAGYNLLVRR